MPTTQEADFVVIGAAATHSAREAGVAQVIKLPRYRAGLARTSRLRRRGAGLPQVIAAIEGTPSFELLRTHTVMGFLSAPVWRQSRRRGLETHRV